MKHLPVVLLLLLASAPAVPADQVNKERMRADLEFLCSPPIEGRVSLSRGADAAAWFLAAEMRKIGLQPTVDGGFLQRFDVVPLRVDREQSSIHVVRNGAEQAFAASGVFFPEPGQSINLTLPVVFAGYGITAPELGYDDYAGLDVTGKAVLIFDHNRRRTTRNPSSTGRASHCTPTPGPRHKMPSDTAPLPCSWSPSR